MARLYDLMLMLDPEAAEDLREKIVGDVQAALEDNGTLVGAHDWGTRRMTFEIDHKPEAAYHLFQFEGDNELLANLDHNLKITEGVLRFRIIALKPGSPPPPTPRAEAPRQRQDGGDTPVAARAAADAPRSGR